MTQPRLPPDAEPPLFVDLDGTLLRGDILIESAFALLKLNPMTFFMLPIWLLSGKATFKAEIARRIDLDPVTLIYDERLIGWLRAEREKGRTLILATASHKKFAEAVARHLGLFDAVLASDDHSNLKGARKLSAIETHARELPFDYAGNETADLPIWRRARKAIVVNPSRKLARTLRSFSEPLEFVREVQPPLANFLRAIRIHQWLKNLLVFVPLAAAHKIGNFNLDIHAIAAFFAFSLCASSVYVLNDLADLRADRAHPRKRLRPFASGDLPLGYGVALIPLLLLLSLSISLAILPPIFLSVLATYYVCSLAYNFWAKERVVWDVMVLATLYALRVLAGAAATLVIPSVWLLAFSLFIFLSLALVKRYSEMGMVLQGGRSQAHGRGYVTADMPVLQSMGVASGYVSVLVVALYINSPEVREAYTQPYFLWPICLLLLLWISRIWVKTHRGQMHDDPVIFAAQDKLSLVIGLLCVLFLALATL